MANRGPIPFLDIKAISDKYTSDEAQKFQAIIIADNSGNAALAEELAGKLSAAENTRLDEYLADLEKIEKYKAELATHQALNESELARLDGDIDAKKQERAVIFSKYEKGITDGVAGFAAKQNAHTDTQSSPRKGKKHSGCTIL